MSRIISSYEYTDPSFKPELSTTYELSILALQDGFSFCVANPASYHILLIKEYKFAQHLSIEEIAELFGEINYWDNNLRLNYANSRLMYASSRFTLLPDALFVPAKARSVIETLYMPYSTPETIKTNHLKAIDAWTIFAIPTPLYTALSNHQPSAKWYHTSVPVCERMVTDPYTGGTTQLIVNKTHLFFELYVTENGNLTLVNQYTSYDKNDLAYFIINTIEQLNLDITKIAVRLLGYFEDNQEYTQLLKKYIHTVILEKNPSVFHGQIVNKIPVYRYLNLMNLHLCE